VEQMIKKKIRHIQRYRDIVYAFTKYGFGFVMKELGLLDLLAVPKKVFVEGNKTVNTRTTGERIRMFLEELGPTFVKIGQIASTRPVISFLLKSFTSWSSFKIVFLFFLLMK
jgi:ubiquinone biosynthesis protein